MNEAITTEELEHRMRPGQYSQGGFLGSSESLENILTKDEHTLAKLEISYDQVASAIETIVENAHEQKKTLPSGEWLERQTRFPNMRHPEENPRFSKGHLPGTNTGYLVGSLQIFFHQWRGFQDCPWGCSDVGSFDFMILNRRTGESFSAPALIVHLIRAHHFFEGVDSPYRVDPERVIRVLEML